MKNGSTDRSSATRIPWRLVAVGGLMVGAAMATGGAGHAQPAGAAAAAAPQPMTSHIVTQPGQSSQLVVVDSRDKVIAVYQINPTSGEISLASVRNITWDLKLEELNSKRFLPPKDIREGLRAAQ